MSRDFRYVMPDGTEIEAFQLHEGSRYQEGGWPDWMDSKMLMTKVNLEGQRTHWLNIADVDTEIPPLGWIVKHSSGTIGVLDYASMETATKVVRDVPKVPDISKPQPDSALQLAVKLTKRPFDEIKALDLQQVEEANRERQRIIDSMHPDDAAASGSEQTIEKIEQMNTDGQTYSVEPDVHIEVPGGAALLPGDARPGAAFRSGDGGGDAGYEYTKQLILEMREVYALLVQPKVNVDEGISMMRRSLSARTFWCDCPPGLCDGERDQWECRQNSLLARNQ